MSDDVNILCIKTSHFSLARTSVTVKIQFILNLDRIRMEKPNAPPMPPGPDEQPPSYEASIQHMPPYPTQGMYIFKEYITT